MATVVSRNTILGTWSVGSLVNSICTNTLSPSTHKGDQKGTRGTVPNSQNLSLFHLASKRRSCEFFLSNILKCQETFILRYKRKKEWVEIERLHNYPHILTYLKERFKLLYHSSFKITWLVVDLISLYIN